jgi:hypothetical protein
MGLRIMSVLGHAIPMILITLRIPIRPPNTAETAVAHAEFWQPDSMPACPLRLDRSQ